MSPDDAVPQSAGAIRTALEAKGAAELLPFPDLSEAEAERILSHATIRQLAPSSVCFEEGDAAQNFYVLIDGVLRVVRTTAEGEQVVVLHITPGQLFGIAKAYDNDIYHASARVAAPGLALSWPSDLWDEFVRDYPGFSLATRQAVGDRVEEL